MINYKWCVCDMDGTLLNSEGNISRENEEALKLLSDMGIEIIIASGRTDLMLKQYIKQLDLKGHIICCNGGLIKHLGTEEILYSKTIESETVYEALRYCFNNYVNFLFYTDNEVFSNKGNPRAEMFEALNNTMPDEFKTPIKYIDDDVLNNIGRLNVYKILLVSDKLDKIKMLEEYFSGYKNLEVVSSFPGFLDIMAACITKGNALKVLSKKTKVELKKVIAFGDNYNDLDMFTSVGMPIAVNNAVDEIKTAAKYITSSNDESGIAYAIHNFILKHN